MALLLNPTDTWKLAGPFPSAVLCEQIRAEVERVFKEKHRDILTTPCMIEGKPT